MSYLDKKDAIDNIEILKDLEIGSNEFRLLGIKIVCSYTKPLILSKKGIEYGSILWDRYVVDDELSRRELFELSLIGSEAALILDRNEWVKTSGSIHKELFTRYKPDDGYLQSLIADVYLPEGYYQENENFIRVIYESIDEIMRGRSDIKDLYDDGV